MRRVALLVVAATVALASVASAADAPVGARLEGKFLMKGKIFFAQDVYGEHSGQHVKHTWTFTPGCPQGPCERVRLKRRRSGQRKLDELVLVRQSPGVYVGHGHFWVALKCAGQVVSHGGYVKETITVKIVGARLVNGTRFATNLSAKYENPSRTNYTRCPGGIGRDGAVYGGRLIGTPGA